MSSPTFCAFFLFRHLHRHGIVSPVLSEMVRPLAQIVVAKTGNEKPQGYPPYRDRGQKKDSGETKSILAVSILLYPAELQFSFCVLNVRHGDSVDSVDHKNTNSFFRDAHRLKTAVLLLAVSALCQSRRH